MAQTANYGFEKPSTDKNVDEEFYQLQETLDLLDSILAALQTAVNGKSAVGHTHAISDVVNLAAELAAKMPASATFSLDDLTDVDGADGAPNGYVLVKSALGWLPSSALAALGPHGHLISEITGLVDALAGKADAATAVRVNAAQLFTQAQRGQARANIGGDVLAGFRNKIINGNFDRDLWQRGTSLLAAAGSRFCADRWNAIGIGSTTTVLRVAFTPGQTDVPGEPEFFHRIGITSVAGSGNAALLRQNIEGVRTLAGKLTTRTFYMKADAPRTVACEVVQVPGTGGSPSAQVVGIGVQKFNLTTQWQRFDVVIALPSISGMVLGTNLNDAVQLNWWLDAGSSFNSRTDALGHQSGTFDIAHVSFVEGDATTEDDPFAARDPEQEKALAFRFYERLQTSIYGAFGSSGNFNSANWPFKVRKRATPAIAWSLVGANPSDFGVDGARAINTANNAPGILAGTSADAEL